MSHTGAELLAAIQDHPTTVINYVFRKEDPAAAKKKVVGATFINMNFNLSASKKCVNGFFMFTNALLSRGITDPSNIKDENENYDCVRLAVRIKTSAMGDLGKAMVALEKVHQDNVKLLVEQKKLVVKKSQQVHCIVQTHYPEDLADAELAGKPKEDPLIKLKVSFEKYSEKHPNSALRSRAKTVILDMDKPFTLPNGKPSWEEATINGKPLDDTNVHLFLNKGAEVVYGVIYMSTLVGSAAWWSVPLLAHHLLVRTGTASEDFTVDEMSQFAFASSANVQAANEGDIDDVLGGMD